MQDAPKLIEHPDRWGLFPERRNGEPVQARALLRHWFVQFNPLYFVSACCVLFGVYLVNRSFDRMDAATSIGSQLLLFGVLQAYELLIVGGAIFLARYARAIRPAVLLILLESFFLFDCTLRLESILLRSPLRIGVSLVWVLLTLAKVHGMAVGLRVRLERRHYVAIAGSAVALAVVVHLLAHPAMDKKLVLQLAAWVGAFVVVALDVRSGPPLSELAGRGQRERAARCARAAFRLLTCAYFYHVWCYILVAEPDLIRSTLFPQAGALFLYWTLVRPHEGQVWGGGALVLVCASFVPPSLPWAALLVGAVFAYRVGRGARAGLAAGAALCVYAGLCLVPLSVGGVVNWPAPGSGPTLILLVTLALIGWRLRDRLAQTLVTLALVYASSSARHILPTTDLGIGILLLVAGFTAFVVGLAVNWVFRAEPVPAVTASEPSGPA
jgi:hypothetical protein